ncbi:hypothetical protein SAMN02745163_01410 [Clostridium cavendishii DSM 21758]|uniref:ABC-2 type transport system permease protein n=1 Tax=Clostridium cavendishii DSM 21758 TaxID=1121302 RepID=A0A1M6GWF4_9CLOT|nr:hypothetical protein [Clostridium cavendishii]SHJ14298.1 hypothetical protein SAMN02745163_01410 [Clostridium cavendishii DSM 21758]
MIALLKYNYKLNKKCNKLMVPIATFLLIHVIFYSTDSVYFVAGIGLSANLVFCTMAWIGFVYCEMQDTITEQVVFLKVKNNNIYWFSKILFMWIIGIILSLVGTIWPIIINISKGGTEFQNGIIASDVILGFIIQTLVALMGVLLAMIIQTKVIGNRNKAILILSFLSFIAVIKGPLIKEYSIFKVITWMLPPAYNIINSNIGLKYFSLNALIIPIIYSVVYILIEIYIYIKLMKKILF